MNGARIEDARGRIVREGQNTARTVRLVGWVCDPVDPATKPAGGPSAPVPVSKPSATKPAGGPSAPSAMKPAGGPSAPSAMKPAASGQASGPSAPIPFTPTAGPSGATPANDYEYPSTTTPSTSAATDPSAATPANDYEYPSTEYPSAAPEPSQNPVPTAKQLINLDGGTVTLGEWRQQRVLGEVVAKYFRSGDGVPQAKPVSIVATPSPAAQSSAAQSPAPAPAAQSPAAQSPTAQSPAPQSPAASPSAREMQEMVTDYEIDSTADSAVTAWQDPLLEGTFAPVDDGTNNESMAIWYVYTACWVGILGFWAYYWIKYRK